MTCQIRPLELGDLDFVLECEARTSHKYVHPWSADTHNTRLNDPAYVYLAGLDEVGSLEGYAILKKENADTVEFVRIAVHIPGSGFGRPFMHAVLSYIENEVKAKKVWLDVYEANSRARHVYKTLGFHEAGQLNPPETSPKEFGQLVLMEKIFQP